MRSRHRVLAILAAAFSVSVFSAYAQGEESAAPVRKALAALETWLGTGPIRDGWNRYLNLPALDAEVAKGDAADQAVVAGVLKQLETGAAGLQLEQFAAPREALSDWIEQLTIAKAGGLPEAVLASQSAVHPITDADVAAAKDKLQKAVAALDKYLTAAGANGAAWKEYLHWKDLESQLASKAPDPEALRAVEQSFTADFVGLELPVFGNVAGDLQDFADVVEARNTDLAAKLPDELKALAEELKQYPQSPTEEAAIAVGGRLGWLHAMRQVPALVKAIRNRLSQPNLHARVSAELVAVGIQQQVDDTSPVRDNILGTDISGTGHTVGQLTMRLVPDETRAQFETTLSGKTLTKTVGYNGPATIYSDGTTNIEGHKRIVIDEKGFASYPATANAATSTQITGIGARRALVQRIATNRVYESKAEAEAIGSQHAAGRVRERLEAQIAQQLSKAQGDFVYKFRNPLLRRRQFPELLKFSTTQDALWVRALQANSAQLGASLAPPSVTVASDLAVQLHESAPNNLLSALLSGATVGEEDLKKKMIEWRGSLPDRFKENDDQEPLSITFAKSQPISVKFFDGGVRITVRGQRYISGNRHFQAMNVTANYKMQIDGIGTKLIRQGDLEIVPPRASGTLSTRQIALRTVLQKKFGKVFEPELKYEGLKLPGRWESAGPLAIKQLQSDSGWLVLAWTLGGSQAETMNRNKVADR